MYSLSILLSHLWFGQEGIVECPVSLAFVMSLNRQRKQASGDKADYPSLPLYSAMSLSFFS